MTYPIKKLGQVVEFRYGKGIDRSRRNESGDVPIYGANGILGWTDKVLISGEAIIVGRKGSAGELTRVAGRFWPSDVTYYVFGNDQIDVDYLFYFLKSVNLPQLAAGVKPGINRNQVYQIEIPVPPLAEQRKIVAKIEKQFAKIDEAARLRAESQTLTAQLLPAALHEIFSSAESKGWGEKSLGDLCDILDSKRKPITKRDRKSGCYPYYGATQVQDYVAGYIFDEPLILLGEDGARWGANEQSAYHIVGKSWVNNHAHVLRPHRDELLDAWLVYVLNTEDLSRYITGTTVKKLNQEKMRSIKIPLPPLAEQKKIVKKLDALAEKARALAALQSAQAADFKALKQSILHEVFSGEVQ